MRAVDPLQSQDIDSRHGEELAEVTNGIVGLFADDTYVVTVLRDTMTTVERTLADGGHGDQVRSVRLTFQEAMAGSFKAVVESAFGRRVASYHSQLLIDSDIGFELFVFED